LFKTPNTPNTPNTVVVVLIVIKLVAIVEVLVPGVVRRIAGKLGRTPVVIIGKTTRTMNKGVFSQTRHPAWV